MSGKCRKIPMRLQKNILHWVHIYTNYLRPKASQANGHCKLHMVIDIENRRKLWLSLCHVF